MKQKWSPGNIQKLMVVASGCSCLVILVCGIAIAVVLEKLPADLLGSTKVIGVGGGLVGLAWILYKVIRVGLKGDAEETGTA